MLSRRYENSKEFKERQRTFDFAIVGIAVMEIAVETKKRLAKMLKGFKATLQAWHAKPVEPIQFAFNFTRILTA